MYIMPVSLDCLGEKKNNFLSFRIQLDENSREARGSLYCLPCHNKLDLPVCAACRRLIDDRVICAFGKQWHVEVCSVYIYHKQLLIIDLYELSCSASVRLRSDSTCSSLDPKLLDSTNFC
jgi:hypothetical protein